MNHPIVSIILPTYNRARFLPEALAAIKSQTVADWELIVIDDGSTDNTQELVECFAAGVAQGVRYIFQENQGAYGARNTGLSHATGKYIAFYDSDDVWLAHHLQDCVAALEANPEVDWVYGACQVVDHITGEELAPSTFYVDGKPRPFLRLQRRMNGPLAIIEDPTATECMILHGLFNGLQNSVIHRRVFQLERFEAEYRNEAEDQLIIIRALAGGRRVAYLNRVHVIYRVHGENSSNACVGATLDRRVRLQMIALDGFERLWRNGKLSDRDRRALRRRLGREYFWNLGYSLLWLQGRRSDALPVFRLGLKAWPWSLRCWKTYLLALLRFNMGKLRMREA